MKRLLASLLLLLLVAFPDAAIADQPAPPRDYAQITENGEYVFVMLVPEDYDSFSERDEAIWGKYPRSGLYHNDGSVDPLWTVDWYAFGVEVSPDGQHLARWGPWPMRGDYGQLAIAFYEDGRETMSYRVQDLVAKPWSLPESVSHYQWRDDSSFHDASNQVYLETQNREHYTFDIETGELTSGALPSWPERIPLFSIATLVLLVLLGYLLFFRVKHWLCGRRDAHLPHGSNAGTGVER